MPIYRKETTRAFHYLNFASAEFAEDTRHQVRSCSTLPQALDNEVDSVKSALPKGQQYRKIGPDVADTHMVNFFISVYFVLQTIIIVF